MSNAPVPLRTQIERSLTDILRRIASGEVAPRPGLGELVTEYRRSPEPTHATYVGEEFGIAQLIGYFYGYEDLEERPAEVSFDGLSGAEAIVALDAEVVRLAQAWLVERDA